MKIPLLAVGLFAFCLFQGSYTAESSTPNSPAVIDVDLPPSCSSELRSQINMEFGASLTYLRMATHFAQPALNRPGFSEFFFKSASEEREHGIKLLDYLMMRRDLLDLEGLSLSFENSKSWKYGLDALNDAYSLEVDVTRSITNITANCESEYHLADYLTTEFLDEQHKGMRDLKGRISTLTSTQSDLFGEFLYDKKLLKGVLL